ncbi:MAG TPA: FAD-binding protein, partial [Leptospiraceae bacterium]|nr:FAD-binding protein [Leptospiraceae bacterium]
MQRKTGIRDSAALALSDWTATAEYSEDAVWPRKWAEYYVNSSRERIYDWLISHGQKFFPIVHWAERGLFRPGNSVPRFHMLIGLGAGAAKSLSEQLLFHRNRNRLAVLFRHNVTKLIIGKNTVGCTGLNEENEELFSAEAENLIIASGGLNGDLNRVRKNWDRESFGEPPEVILNGSHRYADGAVHDLIAGLGGNVTFEQNMWNYPSGVHHPEPDKENHGLTIVPPKSALWMNYEGRRIGPMPLVTAYDTRYIVERICQEKRKYSWQILNWKIAVKELAVQNSDYNEAMRDKKTLKFIFNVIFGNEKLVKRMTETCKDFVTADTVQELAEKMNALNGDNAVNASLLEEEIRKYDAGILRGEIFHNDEQLRRIAHARQYRGDRLRTCRFQPILDRKAGPLFAIREFINSRKSLGGIQTDLSSRVLTSSGAVIPGVYAVGECAGFGGGGIHGKGALEGTFLGSCILT